ncbi:hypothetical protein UFOVP816_59 [uncultured Caudovirales phage]|uniref:Uncharacterized protein n=1 Tax=uncultured Caudovirales phage TaxID=2100421 RepID=A0A6J5P0N1_9CAUD|nr:hypothetical protein UFOVP816_59 [uncultured Caudovirales phage]
MTGIVQQNPYLREQRQFPFDDLRMLANQCDQAYIDVANKVNCRVIGNYAVNLFSVTGEKYFLQGQPKPQQVLRQVFTFTGAGNVPHGINTSTVTAFINCYGEYTDGTNFYGAIYGSSVAIAGQVSFYISPTNIVVIVDAGAPAFTSGLIVLSWISQF